MGIRAMPEGLLPFANFLHTTPEGPFRASPALVICSKNLTFPVEIGEK